MKKFFLSFVTLMILISCNKISILESEEPLRQNNNTKIIKALLGQSNSNPLGRGLRGGNFSVTNENGILKFDSDEGLKKFFDLVDSSENIYDYTNSTIYDDTDLEKYHLGDAMLNEFDSSLSFLH